MPELPDVEAFRRHLERAGLHRRIEHVRVPDPTALQDVTRQRLARSLVGESLERTGRRGKHLFAATSGAATLVLHFGMTGYLAIDGRSGPTRTRGSASTSPTVVGSAWSTSDVSASSP